MSGRRAAAASLPQRRAVGRRHAPPHRRALDRAAGERACEGRPIELDPIRALVPEGRAHPRGADLAVVREPATLSRVRDGELPQRSIRAERAVTASPVRPGRRSGRLARDCHTGGRFGRVARVRVRQGAAVEGRTAVGRPAVRARPGVGPHRGVCCSRARPRLEAEAAARAWGRCTAAGRALAARRARGSARALAGEHHTRGVPRTAAARVRARRSTRHKQDCRDAEHWR